MPTITNYWGVFFICYGVASFTLMCIGCYLMERRRAKVKTLKCDYCSKVWQISVSKAKRDKYECPDCMVARRKIKSA